MTARCVKYDVARLAAIHATANRAGWKRGSDRLKPQKRARIAPGPRSQLQNRERKITPRGTVCCLRDSPAAAIHHSTCAARWANSCEFVTGLRLTSWITSPSCSPAAAAGLAGIDVGHHHALGAGRQVQAGGRSAHPDPRPTRLSAPCRTDPGRRWRVPPSRQASLPP